MQLSLSKQNENFNIKLTLETHEKKTFKSTVLSFVTPPSLYFIFKELDKMEELNTLTKQIEDFIKEQNPQSEGEYISLEAVIWMRVSESFFWQLLKDI